jgi:sec-independent protein translocase protein TatA
MPFGGLGFGELILIFAVFLLLFGAKRLPELASGMGRGIRDFKRALNGVDPDSVASQTQTPLPSAQPQNPPVAQAAATVEEVKRDV